MISEKTICELLSCLLPSGRLNRCFESDAEVIHLNGAQCLFTTDEFSAEDLFRETNAYDLGWNIAAGALSDVFACGGHPLYYAHALTVDPRWDAEYLGRFGAGVRDVLNATQARFIGGDCGRSPVWRCTVSVIGRCDGPPVSRRGAAPGDSIYLSGKIGAGNLEAALRLRSDSNETGDESLHNRFVLRQRESAVMRKHASACIDTSDGVWAGLNALADLNRCGYVVADLPYLGAGLSVLKRAGLPKTLLFLGGCGEYELLFTIRKEREEAFRAEAQACGCGFFRLGEITPRERVLEEEKQRIDLESLRFQARDYDTPQECLTALTDWLGRTAASRKGGTPGSASK